MRNWLPCPATMHFVFHLFSTPVNSFCLWVTWVLSRFILSLILTSCWFTPLFFSLVKGILLTNLEFIYSYNLFDSCHADWNYVCYFLTQVVYAVGLVHASKLSVPLLLVFIFNVKSYICTYLYSLTLGLVFDTWAFTVKCLVFTLAWLPAQPNSCWSHGNLFMFLIYIILEPYSNVAYHFAGINFCQFCILSNP